MYTNTVSSVSGISPNAKRNVVGISQFAVSTDPEEILATYSLGSCLAVAIYDPEIPAGGLLHAMMPLSRLNNAKAKQTPAMFVDTGLAIMLQSLFDLGALRKRLIVKAAGAASLLDPKGLFNIGKRNYMVLRKILWKNSLLIDAEDIGGIRSRSLFLEIATGRTLVKSGKTIREL